MKATVWSERNLFWLILAVFLTGVPLFAQDSAADSGADTGSSGLAGTWYVKMALPVKEKPAEEKPAEEKPSEPKKRLYILTLEGTDKASIRDPDEGEFKVTDVLLQGGSLQVHFYYPLVEGAPDDIVELQGELDEKGALSGDWKILVADKSGEWDATSGFEPWLDYLFGRYGVRPLESVLFWKPFAGVKGMERFAEVPLIVAWLLFGAVFFTLRMKFVNFRLFRHAIDLVRGKYDEPDSVGEVTHFQALSTALSATVGLGNIAGVAIAISIGGPGATFWMIAIGLLGMTAKFTECTLGQKYRQVRPDGKIMGGAMYYLSDGLKEIGFKSLGGVLAILFCILCIGASFGGGNAFQVVQSLGVIKTVVPKFVDYPWVYGMIMTLLGGVVIIGGIRSIARVAEKIVPLMCGIYVLACLTILFMNFGAIPEAVSQIFSGAFDPGPDGTNDPVKGGIIGVLVIGIQRAVFSNEAGVGSAAIAHSAAKVKHPVEEGVVALLEPFIDTVIVCTMTALVIIITGAHIAPENAEIVANSEGGKLTSEAFRSQIEWFPEILAVAVFLFAFSTMISWSYYGERCWAWLFGDGSSMIYRVLFLVFTFLGSIVTATNILSFSDLMILGMALPNILGVLLLSGVVGRDLKEYTGMLERGELEPGYSASGKEENAGEEAGADEAGKAEDEAPEA